MHANRHPVVLLWHMHQPDYRNSDGIYQQPWTYLHAIKDYTDMAAHLERSNQVCAVVNFTPILLQQINDYLHNINTYLNSDSSSDPVQILRDPLLAALVTPTLNDKLSYRLGIIESCLKAHQEHSIERYSTYSSLVKFGRELLKSPERMTYVSESFVADLLVWYHLVWMGETIKQDDFRFRHFVEQENNFNVSQRKDLLVMIRDQIATIIPRYKALAEAGKVELSMTPYAHPIAPLLFNLHSAAQAIPDIQLPNAQRYPGGAERMAWHVEQGMAVFEKCFGQKAFGCWPAEGAVDEPTLRLLDRYGFHWIASGGMVLRHSLAPSLHSFGQVPASKVHHLYKTKDAETSCFFRNDELSDLIGFTYSSWHADDAVADFSHRLEKIAEQFVDDADAFTVIALDGENAWEYYPNNGLYFLQALYKKLGQHQELQLITFADLLEKVPESNRKNLPKIVAGSWVYGNLRTWIGDEDKNRAWDMLVEAKLCFDRVIQSAKLPQSAVTLAQHKLALCESSDWFWWFGDDNPEEASSTFDQLFRLHLISLYQILEQPIPNYLTESFTHAHPGVDLPMGGTMRKAE